MDCRRAGMAVLGALKALGRGWQWLCRGGSHEGRSG
jgi:hypothetical protein